MLASYAYLMVSSVVCLFVCLFVIQFITILDCVSLPTVLNGYFIGNKTHGSAVELVCSTDYTAVGVRTLECVNGKWIGIMPTCELPQGKLLYSLNTVDSA